MKSILENLEVIKMQVFAIFGAQILREINFGDSRSSKSAVFAILGSLKIVNLLNLSLLKVQKFISIKFWGL